MNFDNDDVIDNTQRSNKMVLRRPNQPINIINYEEIQLFYSYKKKIEILKFRLNPKP